MSRVYKKTCCLFFEMIRDDRSWMDGMGFGSSSLHPKKLSTLKIYEWIPEMMGLGKYSQKSCNSKGSEFRMQLFGEKNWGDIFHEAWICLAKMLGKSSQKIVTLK